MTLEEHNELEEFRHWRKTARSKEKEEAFDKWLNSLLFDNSHRVHRLIAVIGFISAILIGIGCLSMVDVNREVKEAKLMADKAAMDLQQIKQERRGYNRFGRPN